jgi:AraC-like DNA-binding protein
MNATVPAVIPKTVDPLGEALHFLRLTGAFYCRTELGAPCGLTMPPMGDSLSFHAVIAGSCQLTADGHDTVTLDVGDVVLVPHGRGHQLVTQPGVSTPSIFDLPHDYLSDRYAVLRHGVEGGERVELICGAVQFEHPAAGNLIGVLPAVIHVRDDGSTSTSGIRGMLDMMGSEARELRAGGETIVTRLCDIVVIQAIRCWLEHDPQARTGWLGALRDVQIGRAITAIHRNPGGDWTVASLAVVALMSRSAFAARFTELVGEPALHYVTRWRMAIAVDQLSDHRTSIAHVAAMVGYESEASFSRAFKRTIGYPPSQARYRTQVPHDGQD